ncbi:hypothetical protein BH20ACT5_BH20ACT5_17790 [soil metagenome]
MARFRRLPVGEVESVIDRILDAHVVVERAGFVAVDFYDGCVLYDFGRREVHLLDFDEYRPGPFVAAAQLSGSRRFMAPEEIGVGGRIDSRTTVFTLGRAARLLLDAGDDEAAWRGTAAQLAVVRRANQARSLAIRRPSITVPHPPRETGLGARGLGGEVVARYPGSNTVSRCADGGSRGVRLR